MSIKRGIITERTSSAARAISVTSTLPIALVLTSNIKAGIYCFDSPEDALESEIVKGIKGSDGTYTGGHIKGNLDKYLNVGVDMFPCVVPTILSIVNEDEDIAITKTNFIDAINNLKGAASATNLASKKGNAVNFKPDIICVGDAAKDDIDIQNAMATVCAAIKARTFIDLNAESNGDALSKRDQHGSDRITPIKCSLGNWNTKTNSIDMYDSGVVMAWLRVYVDGGGKIGYSKSISNIAIPFSSVESPSNFRPGLIDDTDPLTEKQITSFISYKGLRTWEYSTCSADPMWQDARRVRIIDLASEAVIDGIFWAIDKDLSTLSGAKKTLKAFMASLVGDKVMIGFDVFLDLKRTTPERIDAGEFYFVIEHQESPSAKLICVTFDRVNKFAGAIYKIIEEA
ncbi:hypothetical protein [Sulfurimonas sp.]|uniref:hypothetical protein n=1 Tax=Sulfurimonas sp. TaxID=2022749 RepID=UPI0025E978C6|nr:hypothetical protein [Sulfurimonas sp.]